MAIAARVMGRPGGRQSRSCCPGRYHRLIAPEPVLHQICIRMILRWKTPRFSVFSRPLPRRYPQGWGCLHPDRRGSKALRINTQGQAGGKPPSTGGEPLAGPTWRSWQPAGLFIHDLCDKRYPCRGSLGDPGSSLTAKNRFGPPAKPHAHVPSRTCPDAQETRISIDFCRQQDAAAW